MLGPAEFKIRRRIHFTSLALSWKDAFLNHLFNVVSLHWFLD